MMYSPPIPDPYVHDDSTYWPFHTSWGDIVNGLVGDNLFNNLVKITPAPKRRMNYKDLMDHIQNNNKKDMNIDRIKKYTQQLKSLEAKLNDLELQLNEKLIDLDLVWAKVKDGYVHPGVERGMEYGIKMAQLFAKDIDIPGKAEALKAMSMSYALSEKYNEWEKIAYQYALTKQQLDSLKRNYADLKDTLVEALKCFDDAVENATE